jgi:hypothetical protein
VSIVELLARLRNVRSGAGGWTALCPGHDDRENSLSIAEGQGGRILLKCFAGCPAEQIVISVGLRIQDLFTTDRPAGGERSTSAGRTATTQPHLTGCTLAQYAEAKGLPIAFLEGLGLREIRKQGGRAVAIPYRDLAGREVATRLRVALTGPTRFRWEKKGSKPCLYGLDRLTEARTKGSVVLVEGESDSHTLWYHGIPALGIPGAMSWKEEWADLLTDIPRLYVVIEPDAGGQAVLSWLAASRIRERVSVVELGAQKDASSLYLEAPSEFEATWQEALESATPWAARLAGETDSRRHAAWQGCIDLAGDPDILARFDQVLTALGVAGQRREANLLFLIVTSRLLDRPVSAAIKGVSSSGKSFLLKSVLEFFPAHTYYALSAMSERALVYSKEPLEHRILVVYEAAGLQGELATYLIRSLLSEGRVRYETVEKTSSGPVAKLIERPGPTGLIVTTTAVKLHEENETRFFSIPVTDTQEQTKAILRQIAAPRPEGSVDLAPWHALQTWLDLAEHRVVIPYASTVAELIPPMAVRLRRDFAAALSLIKAHAILHQANRPRDEEGCIVASVGDYAVVRTLVVDLIGQDIDASVSSVTRETVDAVASLLADEHGDDSGEPECRVLDVAKGLDLDKSAAWRRVRSAIDKGYLINLEDRKGRPARLVLGDPLPREIEVLPVPERLEDGCTVDPREAGDAHEAKVVDATASPSTLTPRPAPQPKAHETAGWSFGRGFPDAIPGLGTRTVTAFSPCAACETGTFAKFGETSLCAGCARDPQRMMHLLDADTAGGTPNGR